MTNWYHIEYMLRNNKKIELFPYILAHDEVNAEMRFTQILLKKFGMKKTDFEVRSVELVGGFR